VSSPLGPAGGARLAPVTARVASGGRVLALVPDARLLASPTTRFPVYIDPSFTALTAEGDRLDYDPVQSGSNCTGPHWNSPGWSPVGYDNFQQGQCQFDDTDRALYRLSLPNIFDDNLVIISASLQATEVYGSACIKVPLTTSLIDSIHPSTGWPGPNRSSDNVDANATMPVDNGSCNTTEDTKQRVSTGFDVTPDLRNAGGWPNITFRIWEPGSPSDADHVQLTDSPVLQITYTDTPNQATDLAENGVNSGVGQTPCDTTPPSPDNQTNPAPAVSGDPYLLGVYGDEDGAAVRAKIQYWDFTHSGPATTNDDAIDSVTTSEGQVGWQLPSTFMTGLTDGTVVAWRAKSVTGSGTVGGNTYGPYYSPYSDTCYFAVYPNGPSSPALAASGWTQTSPQAVNKSLAFTVTAQGSDPISEFTWSMDGTPPSPASASPAQTCVTGTAEPACTAITGGVATLTVTVPAPGPHDLNVCAWDAGGQDSCTDGAPAGATATFTGKGDPAVSYTSGSSLRANFASALGAGASYDNTMISTQAGSPGNANGDGNYRTIDEGVLNAAGWAPGGAVTVDGATFPLPGYGTASSGPDNLLAADQTIGAGNARGSDALVFLATASYADVLVPGLATGSPDSVPALQADPTAPAVMGGVPVAGAWCAGQAAFDATSTACRPATGTINYVAGCVTGNTSTYTLTVPDWTTGPSDIAALSMGERDRPGGEFASPANLYAFSVPVNPLCTVQSVTLPDVSAAVRPTVGSGVSQPQPALHIFGMALRNNTTATPQPGGSSAAAPANQGWTGAFESPADGAYGPPSGPAWGNQTIRVVLSPNAGSPVGSQVRIRLSDPGFVSGDGSGPLQIGDAVLGISNGGAGMSQFMAPLTFGGASSVTVPAGGDVYSDPTTLTFSAGQKLTVSLYLKNSSVPDLPENTWSSGAQTWVTAAGGGDHAKDTSGSAFGTGPAGMVPLLAGVDVTTGTETINGTTSPGNPTVVVAGNNVIDGGSASARSDGGDAPSQRLAGQLSTMTATSGFGVVDAGVEAGQVLGDGTTEGGVSLLARVDRDILAEPDVGTVVIDEGLEDLLLSGGGDEAAMQNAYALLATQLSGFGVTMVTANLTPCTNYQGAADPCPNNTGSAVQQARAQLNSAIGQANCSADINSAVNAPDSGTGLDELAAGDGTSDNVNLTLGATSGGYDAISQVVGQTVDPSAGPPCSLAAYLYPPTS
jgi:hypothetical protein